jgi:DNA-binding NarL/FixJ family response regulator
MQEAPLIAAERANAFRRPEHDTALHVVEAPAAGAALPVPRGADNVVVVIDHRELERECLVGGLAAQMPGSKTMPFANIEEWRAASRDHLATSAILMALGERKMTDQWVIDALTGLVAAAGSVPVIVIADTDELTHIIAALQCGAKGFIPTSVGLRVAAEAIAMTVAGGVFVPASSVLAVSEHLLDRQRPQRQPQAFFTERQLAVVEALRRGRANKIIAYELNLRESTVKVHIRNIMRKLHATNRTEVAFKIRNMFPE